MFEISSDWFFTKLLYQDRYLRHCTLDSRQAYFHLPCPNKRKNELEKPFRYHVRGPKHNTEKTQCVIEEYLLRTKQILYVFLVSS